MLQVLQPGGVMIKHPHCVTGVTAWWCNDKTLSAVLQVLQTGGVMIKHPSCVTGVTAWWCNDKTP